MPVWLLPCRFLALLALLPAPLALAQFAEAEVKAAFVYNLAKYAEWPESTQSGGVLRICVVGEAAPLGAALASLEGKTVRGLRLDVRQGTRLAGLRPCHIVVLAAGVAETPPPLIVEPATLSVGEGSGFVDAGGMIGMLLIDNRVQFEANAGAARRAGIRLPAQLLKLARRVKE